MENIFKKHIENGESLKIVYNGGSQVGAIRNIYITKIVNDSIMTTSDTSTRPKQLKINKIEIYDKIKHKDAPVYKEGGQTVRYKSFDDVVSLNKKLFEEMELTLKLDNDELGLYKSFKNGKLRATPFACIEYHEFTYEEYYNPEIDEFQEEKNKSQKPWYINVKNSHRNFKYFDKAVETFIKLLKATQ